MPDFSTVFSRIRGRFGDAMAFAIGFSLLETALFSPLMAGLTRFALDHWGRSSVGNFEIARFLFSPVGIGGVLVIGALQLSTNYLKLAGLQLVIVNRRSGWTAPLLLAKWFPRLVEVGLRQVVWYLLLLIPLGLTVGVTYYFTWSGHDLYRLVKTRPPVFWTGASIAGFFVLVHVLIAFRWFVKWILAVPIVLFEPGTTASVALKTSTFRTRGHRLRIAWRLVVWFVGITVLSLIVETLIAWGGGYALNHAGESPGIAVPVTAMVLGVHAASLFLLSVLGSVTFASLIFAEYIHAGGTIPEEPTVPLPSRFRRAWVVGATALGMAAFAGIASLALIDDSDIHDDIVLTAHRAGAAHAPENTIAALNRAIQDRANWVEIDVQLTADGQLAVLHDTNVVRVSGSRSSLVVARSTLAEIQAVDVGTPVDPRFAGEKIPTLGEFLTAAAGKIVVLIELKPLGANDVDPLTRKTVAEVQRLGAAEWCRICSQSYPAIQLARQLEPRMPIGFIAGAALGDLAELNVDFLMVESRMATSELCGRARERNIGVHAWTVKNLSLVAPLMDNGVTGIITDDVSAIRERVQELDKLSPVERILMRARRELTGTPE